MLFKNVASQGVYLFVWDSLNGVPKTGDAANITGNVTKDGGSAAAFGTTHPTEIGGGIYWQPLAQGETNANAVAYYWSSSTSGIQIDPVLGHTQAGAIPQAVAGAANGLTIAGTNAATSFASGSHFIGTVDTITTYTGNTVQTGDAYARLGAPAGASVSADVAAVKGDTGTILTDVNAGAGAIYTRIGAPAGASIAADVAAAKGDTAAIKAKTDNLPATPAAVGSAMTLASGAITDATITLPTEATGSPTTALQLLMWLAGMLGWRKVKKDGGALTITQYMADGTTVKTASAYTSTGGVDTIGKAT